MVEILDRPAHPIIGRLLQESGVWIVAPEDKRYGQDILIPGGAGAGQAGPGRGGGTDRTASAVWSARGPHHRGTGEVDDPGMEIEIVVCKYGVPHEFSADCLAEAGALPDKVRAQDKRQRIDLTDIPFVTIDGEDARDFDDAVYCEPAKVGRAKGGDCWWPLPM